MALFIGGVDKIGQSVRAKLVTGTTSTASSLSSPTGYTRYNSPGASHDTTMFDVSTYGIQTKIAGWYSIFVQLYTYGPTSNGYVENYLYSRNTSGTDANVGQAYTIDTRDTSETWMIDISSLIYYCPANWWWRPALYVQYGTVTINSSGTNITMIYLRE